MKRWLGVLFLLIGLTLSIPAKMLPLSAAGQAEADMYVDFLQALLSERKGIKEICPLYQQVFEKAPQSKLLRRQLLFCALSTGNIEQASAYADFIEMGENDAEDLAAYAFYQLRKGDIAAARQYYEQAVEKDPDNVLILQQYFALLSLVDIDLAAHILQEKKEEYPDRASLFDYETGNLYFKAKQYPTALEYYRAATQQTPDYIEPYLARADIYEKLSQYFLMLHELEEAEKLGYSSPRMYGMMGTVFVLGKDHARAREYFSRAKQLSPTDPLANYFLALYAEQQDHNYAQAAQYLRESADYNSKAERWLQVSFFEQKAGDNKAALRTLEQAYKRFNKNVEIGYFYALLLSDMKQYSRAARVLAELLKTNPQYHQAREVYAFVLEDLGKYKQMEEQAKLLLEQNPRNAAMYNLLGYSFTKRNTRLEEAEQYLIKALEIEPDSRSFADSLAWLYYRKTDYTRALDLLQYFPQDFFENNPEAAYHLGAIYAALDKPQQARPYLELAAPSMKEAAKLLKKLSN